MRRFTFALLASTSLALGAGQDALAADMRPAPVYKAPVAPAPVAVTPWTGCYIGGNVGWGRAKNKFSRPSDGANDGFHTADGFVGGGQVGCDYQFAGNWVIGAQGMFDWTDLKGEHQALLNLGHIWHSRVSWFGTATARLGVTFVPTVLAYVKGGAAWVRNEYQETGTVFRTADVTRSGWTVGGGLEWMFAPSWSVFAEYNFMDFGSKRVSFTPGTFSQTIDQKNLQTVLVGVNYRFFTGR
jgi:outer membrane immunogenic protein